MADGFDTRVLLKQYGKLGEQAMAVAKKEIDKTAQSVHESIQKSVSNLHNDTGGMASELEIKPTSRGNLYHGHTIGWGDKKDPHGVPYEKIANVLNYGRPAKPAKSGRMMGAIAPTFFITDAKEQLQGLTQNINKAIDKIIVDAEMKTQ